MNSPEAKLQSLIVKALRSSGIFCHGVFNEAGQGSAVKQGQYISMGLYPGVADLVVWLPGVRIGYMEVKTATGKQSPGQVKFQARCEASGVPYVVVRSVDEALKWCLTKQPE